MRIIFRGLQTTTDAVESVLSILKLFKERYGIACYKNMYLQLTLLDKEGHDVELMDAETSEVLSVFEVYRSGSEVNKPKQNKHLRLIVDNTKK